MQFATRKNESNISAQKVQPADKKRRMMINPFKLLHGPFLYILTQVHTYFLANIHLLLLQTTNKHTRSVIDKSSITVVFYALRVTFNSFSAKIEMIKTSICIFPPNTFQGMSQFLSLKGGSINFVYVMPPNLR